MRRTGRGSAHSAQSGSGRNSGTRIPSCPSRREPRRRKSNDSRPESRGAAWPGHIKHIGLSVQRAHVHPSDSRYLSSNWTGPMAVPGATANFITRACCGTRSHVAAASPRARSSARLDGDGTVPRKSIRLLAAFPTTGSGKKPGGPGFERALRAARGPRKSPRARTAGRERHAR